jgi:hypothetical protein
MAVQVALTNPRFGGALNAGQAFGQLRPRAAIDGPAAQGDPKPTNPAPRPTTQPTTLHPVGTEDTGTGGNAKGGRNILDPLPPGTPGTFGSSSAGNVRERGPGWGGTAVPAKTVIDARGGYGAYALPTRPTYRGQYNYHQQLAQYEMDRQNNNAGYTPGSRPFDTGSSGSGVSSRATASHTSPGGGWGGSNVSARDAVNARGGYAEGGPVPEFGGGPPPPPAPAQGGPVPGAPTEPVPTTVHGGEFVFNSDAVDELGVMLAGDPAAGQPIMAALMSMLEQAAGGMPGPDPEAGGTPPNAAMPPPAVEEGFARGGPVSTPPADDWRGHASAFSRMRAPGV